MTKFTVTLESQGECSKTDAYLAYGSIAQACEALTGLKLLDITDDTPSKRQYTRKMKNVEAIPE